MTTLKIALAQSPTRAAWATSQQGGVVEVRGLLTDRYIGATAQSSQQTWTQAMRYELLSDGVPVMVGSYREIVEIAAHLPGLPDWQPVWERAPLAAPRTAPQTRGWH